MVVQTNWGFAVLVEDISTFQSQINTQNYNLWESLIHLIKIIIKHTTGDKVNGGKTVEQFRPSGFRERESPYLNKIHVPSFMGGAIRNNKEQSLQKSRQLGSPIKRDSVDPHLQQTDNNFIILGSAQFWRMFCCQANEQQLVYRRATEEEVSFTFHNSQRPPLTLTQDKNSL